MIQRCCNPKNPRFKDYGSKGISVCERWRKSFKDFFEDMGDRPEGTSLNRINGAKVYCKQNCEWASLSVQVFDTKLSKNNKSGKAGVFWDSKRRKWESYINVNGKKIHLGRRENLQDAIDLRDQAELKYYGFIKNQDEE